MLCGPGHALAEAMARAMVVLSDGAEMHHYMEKVGRSTYYFDSFPKKAAMQAIGMRLKT